MSQTRHRGFHQKCIEIRIYYIYSILDSHIADKQYCYNDFLDTFLDSRKKRFVQKLSKYVSNFLIIYLSILLIIN
jgi:hypothetical protein